ncbi:MAG TPA: hypothetical protein VFW75_06440 [Acetobacteraceae bacterium]|nr:hypothetical protein [Acetobacteraceae bacterium]
MSSMPLPSDLAPDLTAIAWHHLAHTLRKTLPPPLTDTPEDLLRRDQAAIARIAALCPVTVAEADIAALYVATSEQWKHCLELAQAPAITPNGPANVAPRPMP